MDFSDPTLRTRLLGPETAKSHIDRIDSGFYSRYMSGQGIDIGYKGSVQGALPVLPTARGIEEGDYVNGRLPYDENTLDYVYSSHCLEHLKDYKNPLQDWFRVLKVGGHLVVTVPHRDLYEKKLAPPSKYNGAHKRFYTPSSLLKEVEESLTINSYRVRY